MAAPGGTARVRVTFRAALSVVAVLALSVLALRILRSSERVIGWVLFAGALAALLDPLVSRLARLIPRGLAVLVVLVGVAGALGLVVYSIVDDVSRETERLERILPERAAELEREGRFAEAFREFRLEDRARSFVRAIPDRLAGGSAAEAARSTADRGAAVLATGVLTIFFLAYGRRGLASLLGQIPDDARRRRAGLVAARTYHRSVRHALAVLASSVGAGLLAYSLARLTDVPASGALAIWAGLWNIIPVFGAVIGALPIVVLAGARSPTTALVLAVAFIGYQVFEGLVVRRYIERHTVIVGRFVISFAAFVGLELYGLGGALLFMFGATVAVTLIDELTPPIAPQE